MATSDGSGAAATAPEGRPRGGASGRDATPAAAQAAGEQGSGQQATSLEDLRRRVNELSAGESVIGADATGGLPEELPGDELKTAREICLRLLADSARPRASLEQSLHRRGISAEAAAQVLDRYSELGLIDDRAYAEAYVRSKHRERALGRRALRAELSRRGIDDEITIGAVAMLDADDELARATELISRRIGPAMAAGTEAARRRLLGLLDRRGYPADTALQVVDSAIAAHVAVAAPPN